MSEDENQEPYYIIPGPPSAAGPVGPQSDAPADQIYDVPEYSSRRDDPAVRSEEVLGRSPGMTTCSSCRQRVLTHVSFRVGRFAKMLCALFVILGLFLCLVPMLLLPLPLCLKNFKDVQHSCPCCREPLHLEQKRCCQRPTLFLCLVPMLLLPLPLCLKNFKDVQHSCPCCREPLHLEQKRCCQRPT